MNYIELLTDALEFIENNLTNDMKTSDIADACYCSKSNLEKLFRRINNISIHDYIVRRRMMKAAQIIYNNPNRNLLEIGMQYGYSSNEAFTRAFKQVWHCTPTEFRKQPRYTELFPKLLCPLENGDDYMNTRKHIDISELYDLFVERKNCYFVCCDIKNLIPINQISRKAGDQAIIEALNRMNAAAGPEDVVFRIGGDEFALLTNSDDIQYTKKIADTILAQNEHTFTHENHNIPLSLYVSIARLEQGNIKYSDLFTKLHTTIKDNK